MAEANYFHSQYGIRSSLINNLGKGTTGLKKIDYSASNLFQGTTRLDQSNLDKIDPFLSGTAFFIWTKKPRFIDEEIWNNFKWLTERNFKAFDGIGDMSLATDNIVAGFAGNELSIPTNITRENNSFSTTHIELIGSPIREGYTFWTTGIYDPETGLSHYHGKINSSVDMQYSLKNHSAEAIYIVTDVSGASTYDNSAKCYPGAIEFVAYYTNVIPTKAPMAHLNYTAGDRAPQDISMDFVGTIHMSKTVNEVGVKVMDAYYISQMYGDYSYHELNPSNLSGYDPINDPGRRGDGVLAAAGGGTESR